METGTLEKKIAKLPDSLKVKVEEYVDTLMDFKIDANSNGDSIKKGFGGGKGLIAYMADDFDAPLDEFKEYM